MPIKETASGNTLKLLFNDYDLIVYDEVEEVEISKGWLVSTFIDGRIIAYRIDDIIKIDTGEDISVYFK